MYLVVVKEMVGLCSTCRNSVYTDQLHVYRHIVEAAAELLLTENPSGCAFVLESQETQHRSVQDCHSRPSPTPARHGAMRGGDLPPAVDQHRHHPLNGCRPNGDVDQYRQNGTSPCEPRLCDQSEKRGVLVILRGLPGSGKSTLAR